MKRAGGGNARAGKCLECGCALIDRTLIGYCTNCFGEWQRERDAQPQREGRA